MQNPLTLVSGKLNSAVMGAFGASEEHKKYLASGYRCPKCAAPNTNIFGTLQTHFYDSDGKRIMLMTGGALRGDTAECPKCLYRWKMYANTPVAPQPGSTDASVVETDRSEEVLGEDRRVIDNARSSSKLTR